MLLAHVIEAGVGDGEFNVFPVDAAGCASIVLTMITTRMSYRKTTPYNWKFLLPALGGIFGAQLILGTLYLVYRDDVLDKCLEPIAEGLDLGLGVISANLISGSFHTVFRPPAGYCS